MNVQLCNRCTPLLATCDTIGKLRARVCRQCKMRIAIASARHSRLERTPPAPARFRMIVVEAEGTGVAAALEALEGCSKKGRLPEGG
jgi:thymidine kinase